MQLWRISNHVSLSGEGGLRASARWHTKGHSIVYLAGSAAGALIETLVHLNGRFDMTPATYRLLRIEVPDVLSVVDLEAKLKETWKQNPAATQQLGDEWLANMENVVARIPSVIMPDSPNYLLNPMHGDAGQIRIVAVMEERYDSRLFQPGLRLV